MTAWVLALLPLGMTAAVYARLPDQIPTNWGLDGKIIYGDKWQIWMMAGMALFMLAILTFAPKIDPRRQNYEKFAGFYDAFKLFMVLFLCAMNGIVLSESLNPGHISVSVVVTVGVGIMFAFLGNMMPKFKSNFFVGMKNPWTLSSQEVWNKTHRLSGKLWFAGGLVIAASGFFIPEKPRFVLMMVIVALLVLVPSVASFLWYRREEKPEESDGV